MQESDVLKIFNSKVDELVTSKYILADKKIANLLKTIASNKLLFEFFSHITGDYDYDAAKENAVTENKILFGKYTLKLPENAESLCAFVFCLLIELDDKSIDLNIFLAEFFYQNGNCYESFFAFCKQVVNPFKQTVNELLTLIFESGNPMNLIKGSRQTELTEKINKILVLVRQNAEKLKTSKHLSEIERKELFEISDSFEASLATEDEKLIKLMFLCYKYSLKSIKKGDFSLDSLTILVNNIG